MTVSVGRSKPQPSTLVFVIRWSTVHAPNLVIHSVSLPLQFVVEHIDWSTEHPVEVSLQICKLMVVRDFCSRSHASGAR